jgi:hypothetical protein
MILGLVWLFGYFLPQQEQLQAQQNALLENFHSCLSTGGYPSGHTDYDNYTVNTCQQEAGCPYVGGYLKNGDTNPDDACLKGT